MVSARDCIAHTVAKHATINVSDSSDLSWTSCIMHSMLHRTSFANYRHAAVSCHKGSSLTLYGYILSHLYLQRNSNRWPPQIMSSRKNGNSRSCHAQAIGQHSALSPGSHSAFLTAYLTFELYMVQRTSGVGDGLRARLQSAHIPILSKQSCGLLPNVCPLCGCVQLDSCLPGACHLQYLSVQPQDLATRHHI